MATNTYRAEDFGNKEVKLIRKFYIQRDDARDFFLACIKPRLDRSYKLYVQDNTDRSKEIQAWQSNVFVPYIHSVVETLMPRILDARPEFTVLGRTEDDQLKSKKLQQLADYTWEINKGEKVSEELTRSSLIYGTGFLQVGWKKDVREYKFLKGRDINTKKYKWKKEQKIFFDAPFFEWVDNYNLWYDWHNTDADKKQYWFKRLVLTEDQIRRKYPAANQSRLRMAIYRNSGDLTDYSAIRQDVKTNHEKIIKNADRGSTGVNGITNIGGKYNNQIDVKLKMHEVYEWWRPFDDSYSVLVNEVPILYGGEMPNPYDFKEAPFIDIPYLKAPGEFEGYGLPLILENPQIMLNQMKNQRLDAATLNIHKMWVVNPLANINKDELVTRPFGIIYSPDPTGVREIQFSDIKASAYREEEMLKSDMRYASGVDDFSMGAGGNAGSATEVRHLRESTLERVRLFINHLGYGYSKVMRMWISLWRQFHTNDLIVRIIGNDGQLDFNVIAKDDLMGYFDFKAAVIPAIAGMQDVKKKQDMDLFQLLVGLPFIDPKKLTSKVLFDWNWNIDTISKESTPQIPGQGGQANPNQLNPASGINVPGAVGGQPKGFDPAVMAGADRLLGNVPQGQQPAQPIISGGQASAPSASPSGNKTLSTPSGANPRGLNRSGNVNTNISQKPTSSPESQLMNRALSIQK